VPLPHIGSNSGVPGCQPVRQDAGGKVFLQRRLHGLLPQPALPQRLTGGVEVQRAGVGGKEGLHANVRLAGVDAGPQIVAIATETVADAVLDAQRDEIEALQRRLDSRDVYAQGLRRREPPRPVAFQRQPVDVVFLRVAARRHAQQHARGNARMQVDAVADRPVAGEGDAAAERLDVQAALGGNVFGKKGFEAARAGGEVVVHFRKA
jgi:hypothetical protein